MDTETDRLLRCGEPTKPRPPAPTARLAGTREGLPLLLPPDASNKVGGNTSEEEAEADAAAAATATGSVKPRVCVGDDTAAGAATDVAGGNNEVANVKPAALPPPRGVEIGGVICPAGVMNPGAPPRSVTASRGVVDSECSANGPPAAVAFTMLPSDMSE